MRPYQTVPHKCKNISFICAGLQSAALILLMRNGMYSKLEYAIAVATVVVHALLLLWAAVLVYYNVVNLLQGRKGKNQFGAMVAFRNPLNSYLLLVTVLSPFLFLFIVSITEKYQWINIAVETVYMIVCGVLTCAAPFALGVLILTKKDEFFNLSFWCHDGR